MSLWLILVCSCTPPSPFSLLSLSFSLPSSFVLYVFSLSPPSFVSFQFFATLKLCAVLNFKNIELLSMFLQVQKIEIFFKASLIGNLGWAVWM